MKNSKFFDILDFFARKKSGFCQTISGKKVDFFRDFFVRIERT